jgi:hypothetical protein
MTRKPVRPLSVRLGFRYLPAQPDPEVTPFFGPERLRAYFSGVNHHGLFDPKKTPWRIAIHLAALAVGFVRNRALGEAALLLGVVSGVYLPEPRATDLLRRAAFIRGRAASGTSGYLTSDSYLVRKRAGAFPSRPVVDAFWENTTRKEYDLLLEVLTRPGHEFLYFDAPGTLPHHNTTSWESHARVRRDLEPQFEKRGVEEGWEVWRRRGRS